MEVIYTPVSDEIQFSIVKSDFIGVFLRVPVKMLIFKLLKPLELSIVKIYFVLRAPVIAIFIVLILLYQREKVLKSCFKLIE